MSESAARTQAWRTHPPSWTIGRPPKAGAIGEERLGRPLDAAFGHPGESAPRPDAARGALPTLDHLVVCPPPRLRPARGLQSEVGREREESARRRDRRGAKRVLLRRGPLPIDGRRFRIAGRDRQMAEEAGVDDRGGLGRCWRRRLARAVREANRATDYGPFGAADRLGRPRPRRPGHTSGPPGTPTHRGGGLPGPRAWCGGTAGGSVTPLRVSLLAELPLPARTHGARNIDEDPLLVRTVQRDLALDGLAWSNLER